MFSAPSTLLRTEGRGRKGGKGGGGELPVITRHDGSFLVLCNPPPLAVHHQLPRSASNVPTPTDREEQRRPVVLAITPCEMLIRGASLPFILSDDSTAQTEDSLAMFSAIVY